MFWSDFYLRWLWRQRIRLHLEGTGINPVPVDLHEQQFSQEQHSRAHVNERFQDQSKYDLFLETDSVWSPSFSLGERRTVDCSSTHNSWGQQVDCFQRRQSAHHPRSVSCLLLRARQGKNSMFLYQTHRLFLPSCTFTYWISFCLFPKERGKTLLICYSCSSFLWVLCSPMAVTSAASVFHCQSSAARGHSCVHGLDRSIPPCNRPNFLLMLPRVFLWEPTLLVWTGFSSLIFQQVYGGFGQEEIIFISSWKAFWYDHAPRPTKTSAD